MMGRDWSSLPAVIVDSISSHLFTDADQVHIHQVCSHWRACTFPLAAPRPWIVATWPLDEPSWRGPDDPYSLWLPRGREPVYLKIPADHPVVCLGAPQGWLALVDDQGSPTRFLLWDPISGSEILLPCLGRVMQVFLSADPLASENWMALATQDVENTRDFRLLYWRPGGSSWNELPRSLSPWTFGSFAFHQDRIYFADVRRYIFYYDVKLGGSFHYGTRLGYSISGDECRNHDTKVVTCNGDLLVVLICDEAKCAHVYSMLTDSVGKITDLGEYSLFLGLGWGDTFALSASEFPGIKSNRVYYLQSQEDCLPEHWMTVFDLSSGVSEQVPYPEEHEDDGSNWMPFTWFCPRKPFVDE